MSLGKLFFLILGIIMGTLTHNWKVPNMSDYLYLVIGLLGGYFIYNFIPYYFAPKEGEKLQGSASSTMGTETPPSEITVKKLFKASILGDPITPDEVTFDKKGVTFNVKELFGNTETFVLYSDISGVEIVEGILLSTIKIKPKTRNTDIKIDNFAKEDAKLIKKLILEKL
jgi:hypothetical protein